MLVSKSIKIPMNKCWLAQTLGLFGKSRWFQSWSDISRHSKVWILINCTGNQTWDIEISVENCWEGTRETGRCLNGRETDFAHGVGIAKTENALDLVVIDCLLDSKHIPVEFFACRDIIQVGENKSLLNVETASNNI